MRDIRLTAAAPADADGVLALYQSQIGVGTSDWDDDYPTMAFAEADITVSRLFIAREDGEIIAAASLLDDEDCASLACWTPAKAGYLLRLCVKPALHGRGAAGLVVARIEETAVSLGLGAVRLLCAKSNAAALRVYPRAGYTRCGECRFYDTDFFCFEKILQKIG